MVSDRLNNCRSDFVQSGVSSDGAQAVEEHEEGGRAHRRLHLRISLCASSRKAESDSEKIDDLHSIIGNASDSADSSSLLTSLGYITMR